MGSLIRAVAPIALSVLAPGLGTAIGAGLGATGAAAGIVGNSILGAGIGGLTGGGLKGALMGGVTGGLAGGGSEALLGKVAPTLAGTGLKAASGAITGAAGGLTSGGGLKSALLGGVTGGALGGLTSLAGDPYAAVEAGDAPGASWFDRTAGDFASSGVGQKVLSGVNAVTGGSGSGGVSGAGAGAGTSTFNKVATIGGLINSSMAADDAEEQLLAAQGKSQEALDPYLEAGKQGNERLSFLLGLSGDPNGEGFGSLGEKFTPGDFTADPGYNFRLQEGQKAIDRSLGARGKVFSGEALTDAQNFGQGLADQTYNDAYNRWRAGQQDIYSRYANLSNTGQTAANTLTGINDNVGNAQANNTIAQSNLINRGLSSIFGADLSGVNGSGARKVIGRRTDGSPIYEDELMGVSQYAS